MELADLIPEPTLAQTTPPAGSRRAVFSDYADPVVASRARAVTERSTNTPREPGSVPLHRPDRAPVGGHVHRLAIPGSTRPNDGETRDHLGRSWVYQQTLKAWQRVT